MEDKFNKMIETMKSAEKRSGLVSYFEIKPEVSLCVCNFVFAPVSSGLGSLGQQLR